MKIKTSELITPTLDWAVAKCEGVTVLPRMRGGCYVTLIKGETVLLNYSTNWAQGGPIIERENIEWQWLPSTHKAHQYGARKPSLGGLNRTFCMDGPTILIAAMRCYVASQLGDEIEAPDELL